MKLTRRTFMGALGGAALSALGLLYPGIQAPSTGAMLDSPRGPTSPGAIPKGDVRQMKGPDPSYAGGQVVEKTTDGVILKSDAGVRAVRIPAETVVWKEFDVKPDVIQLDDWLDVKGEPLPDGTLLARSGWVFEHWSTRRHSR